MKFVYRTEGLLSEGHVGRVIIIILVFGALTSCARNREAIIGGKSQRKRDRDGGGIAKVFWHPKEDVDIYGYNIYRSETESGPFRKVNEEIIRPGKGSERQEYTDRGLKEDRIYYYYIEALRYAGGERERITPVTPVIVGKPWEK